MKLKVKQAMTSILKKLLHFLILFAANFLSSLFLMLLFNFLSWVGVPLQQVSVPEIIFLIFLFIWQYSLLQVLLPRLPLLKNRDFTRIQLLVSNFFYILLLFLIVS